MPSWLGLILKEWKFAIIIVLALSNAFWFSLWKNTAHELSVEKTAHASDLAAFKQAQKDADAMAKQIRDNLLKEAQAHAALADKNYSNLLSEYRSRLMRYQADQRRTKQTDDNQLSSPKGVNGPGAGTHVPPSLTITMNDAEICAVNTARLQAAHEWANSLPKEKDDAP